MEDSNSSYLKLMIGIYMGLCTFIVLMLYKATNLMDSVELTNEMLIAVSCGVAAVAAPITYGVMWIVRQRIQNQKKSTKNS